MTEGLADASDQPNARHAQLYQTWAEGGTGLLITGNVMVDRRFLERPGNVVFDEETDTQATRIWANAASPNETHCWVQLNHPGRQCTRLVNAHPLSASDVQLNILGLFGRPRAMTVAEIESTIMQFATAAAFCKEVGFTGVQIHAAHGYLISQFLSPVTNVRTDDWGGPLENRARLLLEIVRRVRENVGPAYPIGVKLNSADFQKGGFSLEECCTVAGFLETEGVDVLELSGGTYERIKFLEMPNDTSLRESTKRREAFFLEYARSVRAVTTLPLAVTGGFRSKSAMEAALEDGALDIIGLARPLCVMPDGSAQLIKGTCTELPVPERELRLGKGHWGPSSKNNVMKTLNAQAAVAWFYRQIIHLSEGRPPDSSLTARQALRQHLQGEWALAWKRRRYRA